MLFTSLQFLIFFPIVCLVYFLIPRLRWQNYFLLIASYYFYMCWNATYALLLLSSTLVTYFAAIFIERDRSRAKLFLTVSLIINLGILFFFKYYAFAAENVTCLMSNLGILLHIPEFKVLLPVGISFYIFQALGYSIDVYRGDTKAERNFFTYALFVSFFPQLVAGPIERSTNLLQQFYTKKCFNGRYAIEGIHLMLWGYFLKLVVADNSAIYVDAVFANLGAYNGGSALLAAVLFLFTLYGDFAGYTCIAIGCAKVMGFNLNRNFRYPLFYSVSVQDFWHRWHISLSTWLRDYVYIPLGGSRRGNRYVNLMITMLISGFWHGASWTYVICFLIFGFYLVMGVIIKDKQARFEHRYDLTSKEWWLWLNRLFTFMLAVLAFTFFRAETVTDAMLCIQKIGTNLTVPDIRLGLRTILLALVILFMGEFIMNRFHAYIERGKQSLKAYAMASGLILFVIYSLGIFECNQFIYFQF